MVRVYGLGLGSGLGPGYFGMCWGHMSGANVLFSSPPGFVSLEFLGFSRVCVFFREVFC